MSKFSTDIVIGLEIHIGINTKSKLFCNCPNTPPDKPNSNTCPICLGHPGAKPVPNIQVIKNAILLGKALNSKIAEKVIFSRKSYFYPDLAKNYQITQYEMPICSGGKIKLPSGKEIDLTRIHIEEDPASLVGFSTGLLNVAPMASKTALLLPLTLFVFPSLLEEAFFRGVLIPRNIRDSGTGSAAKAVA
ncbi:MAG: hypothetical protein ACQER9_04815, partial [Nanobdellota archaeon]